MFIDEISLKLCLHAFFAYSDIHAHGQHILNITESPQ
jgi:hypothetical protein